MRKSFRGKSIFYCFITFVAVVLCTGCAYRMGHTERKMVADAKTVRIPMFVNRSHEVGIEVDFTKSLIQEFNRSHLVTVTEGPHSDVLLRGTINSVRYISGGKKTADTSGGELMPMGTVLATEYRIVVNVTIEVLKTNTLEVLWSTSLDGEKSYAPPQVTLAGVNSVNALYNLSVRRQNIQVLAADLMSTVHRSLTENF